MHGVLLSADFIWSLQIHWAGLFLLRDLPRTHAGLLPWRESLEESLLRLFLV